MGNAEGGRLLGRWPERFRSAARRTKPDSPDIQNIKVLEPVEPGAARKIFEPLD